MMKRSVSYLSRGTVVFGLRADALNLVTLLVLAGGILMLPKVRTLCQGAGLEGIRSPTDKVLSSDAHVP